MVGAVNISDLPLVSPEALGVPMRLMINSGRGLVLLRGADETDLRDADGAIWDHLDDSAQRLAVALRFRCLVQVFAARRLKNLLLRRGFIVIAAALKVAAGMRLNAERGFNPFKFARALDMVLADTARAATFQVTPAGAAFTEQDQVAAA